MILLTIGVLFVYIGLNSATILRDSHFFASNETHILEKKLGAINFTSLLSQAGGNIVGLVADLHSGLLYWSNNAPPYKGIYGSTLDGNDVTRVIQDIGVVNGLTVDSMSSLIFWTDERYRTVQLSRFDGTYVKTVIKTDIIKPRGIAVDNTQGFIYWGDQGKNCIERSYYDGSARRVIAQYPSVVLPNQLSMDPSKRFLYWVDASLECLMMFSTDTLVLRRFDLSAWLGGNIVFGVSAVGNVAVVSTWNSTSIAMVNTNDSSVALVEDHLGLHVMFSVSAPSIYNASMSHVCFAVSNSCSHLCLMTSSVRYTCACPDKGGLLLGSNENRCEVPSTIILFTLLDRGEVWMSSQSQLSPINDGLIGRSSRPVSVTYDPSTQMVYWSDTADKAIFRASYTGSKQTIFLNASDGLGFVEAMDFDWRRRHLYFASSDEQVINRQAYVINTIQVMDTQTRARKTVTTTQGTVGGLYYSDTDSKLYYTEYNESVSVSVCLTVQGSCSQLLGSANGLQQPVGVVKVQSKLYILDRVGNQSQVFVYDESTKALTTDHSINLQEPFSMATEGINLFISDWSVASLIVHSVSSGVSNVLSGEYNQLTGVAVSALYQPSEGVDSCPVCSSVCSSPNDSTNCFCNSFGLQQSDNTSSCTDAGNFILVLDVSRILYVPLLNGVKRQPSVILARNHFITSLSGLQYDGSEWIYFADNTRHSIERLSLRDSQLEVLLTAVDIIQDLYLDALSNRLYYTNTTCLQFIDLNVTRVETVVCGLQQPQALTGVHTFQMIFWAENDGTPYVKRLNLTDSSVKVIWRSPSNESVINSLEGDLAQFRLLILDSAAGQIIECSLDGRNCAVAMSLPGQGPFCTLHVSQAFMFYSDWENGSIVYTDERTGYSQTVVDELVRPTQFVLQKSVAISGHCANSTCSDVCNPMWTGYYCSCQPGRVLVSQHLCSPSDGSQTVSSSPRVPGSSTITTTVATTNSTDKTASGAKFLYCPDDFFVYMSPLWKTSQKVWWQTPVVVSNPPGSRVDLVCPPTGQELGVGSHRIAYEAHQVDKSTPAYCSFIVDVITMGANCGAPPQVVNGAVKCQYVGAAYFCTASCLQGFESSRDFSRSYECITAMSVWSPVFVPGFASLFCMRDVTHYTGSSVTLTFSLPCDYVSDPDLTVQRALSLAYNQSGLCSVVGVIHLCSWQYYDIFCSPPTGNSSLGTVSVVAKLWTLSQQYMNVIIGRLHSAINASVLAVEIATDKYVRPETLSIDRTTYFTCPPGSQDNNHTCRLCPVGTFLNSDVGGCQLCPGGFYQAVEGQLACDPCPPGYWSLDGSYLSQQCYKPDTVAVPSLYLHDGSYTRFHVSLGITGGLLALAMITIVTYSVRTLYKRRKGVFVVDNDKVSTVSNGVTVHPDYIKEYKLHIANASKPIYAGRDFFEKRTEL